ncbi:hypothetical protein ACJW30_02G073000 [Castanea mollissima]
MPNVTINSLLPSLPHSHAQSDMTATNCDSSEVTVPCLVVLVVVGVCVSPFGNFLLSFLFIFFHLREPVNQCVIPGLPDDLALRCLAKLSHGHHGVLETVSTKWRDLIRSSDFANFKAREGWCGNWLFVLTECSSNEWVAYDPEADIWHPLPKIPTTHADRKHVGFSCFDPYRKKWSRVASMRTPRSHFACSVISGKVYVAGGLNLSCTRGLALAEVYDPLTDKWEELPPMLNPQMNCLGLSYKGKFYVLSDRVGLPDQKTSEVLSPADRNWCTVEDIWPFSREMQFAAQVIRDDRVYTVVDLGESLIKTRYTDKGEWHNVGSVPSVILPDHPRPLEAFGYGFASLRHELYIVGGKVLKWEESGAGRFDIVKLGLVRVCDPSAMPLTWREIRPMCGSAYGSIVGCASLEEKY